MVVYGNSLRGALRWSAAEEAALRISAVRTQIDKASSDRSAPAEGQKQLRRGLLELDSIRQFLQDGINSCNKRFLDEGAQDTVLHEALERGLRECEDTRKNVLHALSPSSNATRVPHSSVAAEDQSNTASGGRGPNSDGSRSRGSDSGPQIKRTAHEQQRKLFLQQQAERRAAFSNDRPSHIWARGGRVRPSSATVRRPSQEVPTASRATPARSSEVPASQPKTAWGEPTQSSQVPMFTQPIPQSTQPSGPSDRPTPQTTKLRPSSAPSRPRTSAPKAPVGASNVPGAGEPHTEPTLSAWGKYQDWAQNILNRVQNRRMQQLRQTSDDVKESMPQNYPFASSQGHGAQPPVNTPLAASAIRPAPKVTVPAGPALHALRRSTVPGVSRPASAQPASGGVKLDARAQALREQGNVFFQQKRYSEAVESYTKAIEIETNSDTLYCNRAAANLMLSRFRKALEDSLKAIEIDPTHVKAHWRAAKAHLYLGNHEAAREMYAASQRLADNPADRESIGVELRAVEVVAKCRACLRSKEWQEAAKCANAILEVFPPSGPCAVPWQCLRAEALVNLDPSEASALLTRLAHEDDTNSEVWYLRAKALFYSSHDAVSTSSALAYVTKAKELDPSHLRAAELQKMLDTFAMLRDEGNAAYAAGRWQDAHAAYTQCLVVDPYNASLKAIILCNRAAVCIQCEKWKDGLDDINQSIGYNPHNAKAYTRRGRIHQHQGNHDSAIKDLQIAVQMYPSAENQERLSQALELKTQATKSNVNRGGSFRYFGFAGAGDSQFTRPETSTRRPQSALPGGARSASAYAKVKTKTYYDSLSITRTSDERTIVKAYREAALKWHPDKWACSTEEERHRAESVFKEISTAYNVLRDPVKRRQYDLTL